MEPDQVDIAEAGGADAAPETAPRAWWGAIGGAVLVALAAIFMIGGVELGLGSPFRLGTGAFPFLTGALLACLGGAIIAQDLRSDGLAETPDWISFLAISAALAVFASSADRTGLLPAAFLTTVIASAPDRSLSWPGKCALGAVVALGAWLLFIKGLGLPFKPLAGI